MEKLWPVMGAWSEARQPFVLGTLVAAEGSTPREVGAVLIAYGAGEAVRFHGGVSSGCVENALFARVPAVLAHGRAELHDFGPEEVTPWASGLTCGGSIRVRLEPWLAFSDDPVVREIASVWAEVMATDDRAVLLSRGDEHLAMLPGGSVLGDRKRWPAEVLSEARRVLEHPKERSRLWGEGAEAVFLRAVGGRPRLFLVGAVEVAVELARMGAGLPVRVVVVDPRGPYLAPERFSGSRAERVEAWPADYFDKVEIAPTDAVVVLAHDEKIDDPALLLALRSSARFVGALGSEVSQERRRERLRAAGLS
ncbi:MAG: XdhC family protein, partial [Verrucomicrobiota bacterium]